MTEKNIIKIYNTVNRFTIDWTLNTLCTYHCSYCPENLHRDSNVLQSPEQDPIIIKNFLNKLKTELIGRNVHMFINGGEPTISPILPIIIDFAYECNWTLYINTNGSRSLNWWKEFAPKIQAVNISYHPESVDDTIFEKVELISQYSSTNVFTLMHNAEPFWTKSVNAYNKFKTMFNVGLKPSRVFKRQLDGMSGNSISVDYSTHQLNWLEDNINLNFIHKERTVKYIDWGENKALLLDNTIEDFDEVKMVNSRKNKYFGWKCNMGIDSLHIYKTKIFSAACKQQISLGDIFNFSGLLKKSTMCETEWCMCTGDVLIPKEKIK